MFTATTLTQSKHLLWHHLWKFPCISGWEKSRRQKWQKTVHTQSYITRQKRMTRMRVLQPSISSGWHAKQKLELFYENVVSKWRNSLDHILSHVILAPPIEPSEYHVNCSGFTQDTLSWRLADKSKIDGSNFLRMYLTSAQRSIPVTFYPIWITMLAIPSSLYILLNSSWKSPAFPLRSCITQSSLTKKKRSALLFWRKAFQALQQSVSWMDFFYDLP